MSNVRIFVSSSSMGCSVSCSSLPASEGMSVMASSAESGVRVPASVSAIRPSLHGHVPSRARSTSVISMCVSNRLAMACRLSSCLKREKFSR